MKYLFTIILIFSFLSVVQAQETTESDTLNVEKKEKYQLYIAPTYSANQFVETVASFAGLSVGITYQTKLDANLYFNTLLDNFRKQIIFPTTFIYEQMNAGIGLQYYFYDKKISPLVGVGIQYAQLSWKADSDLDDEYTDHVFIYYANLGAIWRLSNIINAQAEIGYNIPGELDLVGLDKKDLQGIRFDLAIKIYVFSF